MKTMTEDQIEALAAKIKAMSDMDCLLDMAVYDEYAPKLACAINNNGYRNQIERLVECGWTEEDIVAAAKVEKEELECS